MLTYLLSAATSFLFLFAVFRPLEIMFPADHHQRFFRPYWFTDLCFFLGQYLLWGGLVLMALKWLRSAVGTMVPIAFADGISTQPFWLQAIEVVVISDIAIYWGHRLQHRVGWLWRFHSIHHSAPHLDWLAAHREHPVDTIYTMAILNLPVFVLGFPLETLAWLYLFRGLWAIYIHSNVRLPIGPLRAIVGAPELHHWHHHPSRHSGNYGNVSPLMDLLFGTYRCPDHEPESFGIQETIPSSYLGQLLWPFFTSNRKAPSDQSTRLNSDRL
jgi:sterol desaturase/sphingolipid hydroxylase (fatty acid hydroxylase superfamily)